MTEKLESVEVAFIVTLIVSISTVIGIGVFLCIETFHANSFNGHWQEWNCTDIMEEQVFCEPCNQASYPISCHGQITEICGMTHMPTGNKTCQYIWVKDK